MINFMRHYQNTSMDKQISWKICCLFLMLLVAIAARTQVSGATLSGAVTDKSGAVIPGATVVIRNIQDAQTRTLIANKDGFYSAPNLTPGTYEVKVTAIGFSTLVQKSILLAVGADSTFNPAMAIGGLRKLSQ
jgi:hypothetical protein